MFLVHRPVPSTRCSEFQVSSFKISCLRLLFDFSRFYRSLSLRIKIEKESLSRNEMLSTMQRSDATKLMVERLVHRHLSKKGTLRTYSLRSPSGFCCCLVRGFSGFRDTKVSYRNRLSCGLGDIKLDGAVDLFQHMVRSRPFPSMVDFSKLLSSIVRMKQYGAVISLCKQIELHTVSAVSLF